MWRCLLIFQLLFLKEVAGPPIQISVGDSRKYVEDLLDKDQDPDEILQINNHIWKKRPGFMLEGDILKEVSRHALSAVFKKWPKTGKCVYVPYVLSTQYNEDQRKILYEAFENFARVTCIRFKKQEDETDFLFIAPVSGCYSYIGRSGGSQLVSLDSTCIRLGPGVAQHELMHALGFYHEQTRPDRDSYVKVLFDNIDAVFADNFQIREGNMQGIPYDYASIMHYSSKAFTKNGEPTMVPFPNSNIAIGQRKAFSDNDILRINLFYNCDISQLGAACESYSFDNPSQELDSLDETILLPPFSKAAVRALRNVNVDGNHSIFSLLSNMEFSDILSPAFHGRGSRSLSLNAGEADLTTSRKTSMYWTTEAKSSKGILPTSTGDPADVSTIISKSSNILALLNGSGTEEPTVSPDVGNLIATVSNSPVDILSPPPRGSRSISNSTEEPDISNLIASLSNSSDNILALLNGLGTEEPTVSPELGNLIATVSNSPGDILSPPPRGSRSISNSTEEPNINNLIASLSNSSDNILALLNGLGTEWPTDVSAVSPGVSSMAAASNSSVNILASLDGLGLLSPLSTEGLSEAQLLHSCNFELNLCGWKHWPNGDFEWTLSRERPEEFEKNSLPNGETSCRNFAGQYLYLRPPFLLERVQTAVLVSPVFQGSKCFSFWYSVFGQGVKILAIHLQYLHSPDSWHKLWSVERAMTRTWYFEKLDILMDADIKFQIILEGTLSNVNGDAAIDDIVVSGYGCEEFSAHPSPSAVSGLLSTSYPALPLSNDSDTLFCDFENNLCGWQLCSQGDLNWVLHHERSLDTATLLNTSLSGCSMFQGQYLYAEVTSSHLGNRALLASPHFQGSRCMSFWYSMFGNDFGSLNVYVQYAKSPDTWNKVWSSKGSNSRKWYLAELDLFIQPHEVFQIILEWTTERCCGNVAVDDLFVTSHHCNVKTTHEP
ncbi:uncharacterized protein LOC114665886 isoform X3 [Erpetoichthys calabaricus]|uniref:uncharacterized protein LOC114665886 isoform X3 n=1 Tax=Erpetoichthys calabaricus TaxID=27687 RepID=UPI002234E78B|nr:uncharacterized protein LOC114665886 isoform X3 [Erpetoichthys calabaricus]